MLTHLIFAVIPLMAYGASKAVRLHALRHAVLAPPTERSSHAVPTPTGGGLGFVAAVLAGCLALFAAGKLSPSTCIALAGAGGAVALVGWLDDRRDLPVLPRLAVHALAALWMLHWLDAPALPLPHILGTAFFFLAIVWLVNAYNFMDGIDGLAAAEAVTAGLAGSVLFWGTESGTVALVAAFAVAGFVPLNWTPAKLFMGDAGSCFLGALFALLWLRGGTDWSAFLVWPVLLGVFVVDATVTLVWRMCRGEKWYAAHRTHAYQLAAERWGHAAVVKAVMAVNLLWLFPCAAACRAYPPASPLVAALAYAPLFALCVLIKIKKKAGNALEAK